MPFGRLHTPSASQPASQPTASPACAIPTGGAAAREAEGAFTHLPTFECPPSTAWQTDSFPFLPWRAAQAELEHAQLEGRHEALTIAEEGLTVQVPIGADFIQTPGEAAKCWQLAGGGAVCGG